jgi:hypothetical protein
MADGDITFTPLPYYDIPIIGDQIAKIGRATTIFANPCAPNPTVWVYALFHAAPVMAVSLLKPELVDLNIKHRGRKDRKGKKMRFFQDYIFRDSIIDVPTPRWAVFQLYEFGQRLAWYFMVLDVTLDGVINWQTMVYQWSGCDDPSGPPYATGVVTPAPFWIVGGEGWVNPGWLWTELHKASPIATLAGVRLGEACIPYIVLSLNVSAHSSTPQAAVTNIRITHKQTGDTVWERAFPKGMPQVDGFKVNLPPTHAYDAGAEFELWLYKTQGSISNNGSTWEVTSAKQPWQANMLPDP